MPPARFSYPAAKIQAYFMVCFTFLVNLGCGSCTFEKLGSASISEPIGLLFLNSVGVVVWCKRLASYMCFTLEGTFRS